MSGKLDRKLEGKRLKAMAGFPTDSMPKKRRVALPIIPAPAGARPFDLSGERLLELETESYAPDLFANPR